MKEKQCDFKARIQLADIHDWYSNSSIFMMKSDIERNSVDTHIHTVLSSVCMLLANTKHTQIASLFVFTPTALC